MDGVLEKEWGVGVGRGGLGGVGGEVGVGEVEIYRRGIHVEGFGVMSVAAIKERNWFLMDNVCGRRL